MVKISAYDFSIYGGLKGKVEEISADSINTPSPTNPKGESFYIIRVRTHQNYLESRKGQLFIIPGMMASVDVLTGRKSVLDYLLKPIMKAKQNALRER
jgi:adhesin transport system membrane fusion protein